jgi:outer membrane protein assembly factor BamD
MNKKIILRWVILFPLILCLLSGCGGKRIKTIEGDPEVLYKQGLALFNKRDYSEAAKRFEQLKSVFPDSPPYTLWAELKIGDCHLLKKDYVEAVAAYEEFKKTHPTHEEIPYVQYQIGMAYFSQMRTPDRDQTSTKKAFSSFEYLIANYPPSLFTERAKAKMDVCKKQLADHEFYIGNFYYNRNKFKAAAIWFEGLLEEFPQRPEEDRTLYLLGRSYLELNQWKKADIAFMKIVTEYPKSLHYKEARAILDKGVKENGGPPRKAEIKEAKKRDEVTGGELSQVALVKFEEEGRQPISLKTPIPAPAESLKPIISMKEETKAVIPPLARDQKKENQIRPLSPATEAKKIEPIPPGEPMKEGPTQAIPLSPESGKITVLKAEEPAQEARIQPIPPFSPPSKTGQKKEGGPDDGNMATALSSSPPLRREEKAKKIVLPDPGQAKLAD